MAFWKRILYWLRLRADPGPEYYRLDEKLQLRLINLALQEGRSEVEVIDELVAAGLQKYSGTAQLSQNWQALSMREQDMTALACLGYTNRQIAAKLGISVETVKTHMSSTLYKLNLHSRKQLRVIFAGWDFSAWEN
jgi:DNA-binding CsgD family transcriptional regulator